MSKYNNVVVDQTDEYFDAVWDAIKKWDINVPDSYSGYQSATGNHVQVILDAINKVKTQKAYEQAMKGVK